MIEPPHSPLVCWTCNIVTYELSIGGVCRVSFLGHCIIQSIVDAPAQNLSLVGRIAAKSQDVDSSRVPASVMHDNLAPDTHTLSACINICPPHAHCYGSVAVVIHHQTQPGQMVRSDAPASKDLAFPRTVSL